MQAALASIQGSIHSSLTPRSSLASMTPRTDPLKGEVLGQTTPQQPASAPAGPPTSPAKATLTKENLRAMSEPAAKKAAGALPLSPVLPDCEGSPEPMLVPPHRRTSAQGPLLSGHAAQSAACADRSASVASFAPVTDPAGDDGDKARAGSANSDSCAAGEGVYSSTPLPMHLHWQDSSSTADACAQVTMVDPVALQRKCSNKENDKPPRYAICFAVSSDTVLPNPDVWLSVKSCPCLVQVSHLVL